MRVFVARGDVFVFSPTGWGITQILELVNMDKLHLAVYPNLQDSIFISFL